MIDSEFELTKAAFRDRVRITRGPNKVERAKKRLLGGDDRAKA